MSLSWSDIQELVVPIRISLLITWKLLNQGCLMVMLVSSLRKFYGIYVTNDHGYVSTSRPFCHSWLICRFVPRVTRGVPLVERELLALPEHLNSPPVFSGVDVAGSFVFCVVFCRSSFVIFSLDVVLSVLRFTDAGYLIDIFILFLYIFLCGIPKKNVGGLWIFKLKFYSCILVIMTVSLWRNPENKPKNPVSWHLIIVLKHFFEQRVFKNVILSLLTVHFKFRNSNFHWPNVLSQIIRNLILYHQCTYENIYNRR